MVVLYFFPDKKPFLRNPGNRKSFLAQEEIKADVLNVLVNHAVLNKEYVAKKNE